MTDVFICDGLRTPIGRVGGSLSSVRPDDLAAVPIAALLVRNPGLDPTAIDDVILGCANQAGEDNRNVARMASLLAGLPDTVSGATINRLCASGADAVGTAARMIKAGEADLVIAGGVESMSRSPYVMGKASKPFSREQVIEDTTIGWRFVNPRMRELYGVDSMPQTAENVASELGIGRRNQDAFALRSQERAAGATAFLAGELCPVEISAGRGISSSFERDEGPRSTSIEALAALRPVVHADGSVTAGNASSINDGAAALIIANGRAAARHGLTPRARILGMATAGVAPRVMGIGPVPATRKLLDRLGLTIDAIDLIELNEAFAAQSLAVLRVLGLPDDAEHVNPNGGAIALGHPLGMTGARLALTASRQLEQMGGRYALITLCIGVGQGLALAIERV